MGMLKEAATNAAHAWVRQAEAKGYKCVRCFCVPPHEERDIYFETRMCGFCQHTAEKDD